MRLDLPATTGLLRARIRSCRQFERTRDLVERCLLCFAHRHPADAKKSALLGGLRNVLAIWRSQPLKAAVSPGALASTTAPACRSVSMHLALISLGLLPVSFCFRPSRAALRPSAVSKS